MLIVIFKRWSKYVKTWPSTGNTHISKLLSEVCFLSDHLPPRKEVGGRESRGQRVLAFESPPTLIYLVPLLISLVWSGRYRALTSYRTYWEHYFLEKNPTLQQKASKFPTIFSRRFWFFPTNVHPGIPYIPSSHTCWLFLTKMKKVPIWRYALVISPTGEDYKVW